MHAWRVSAVLAATVWVVGLPTAANAQGLMVTGYADLEFVVDKIGSDAGSEVFFDNHHVNLILIGEIFKNMMVAAEVEYEHAGEEIKLEYGYFGYTGIRNTRIMAGKFIIPFGRFNKDLHPTIINKIPDRPHGFKNILPQTYADVGLWVNGAWPLGMNGTRFVYDAFVINGLMGDNGGDIRDFRDNDREKRTGLRDKNKAVGGRLGLDFAAMGLDFGGSIYNGNSSNDEALDKLTLTLFGFDAAYRTGGLELRAEVVRASQDTVDTVTGLRGSLSKTGGYAQAAYRIQKWEPVFRVSTRRMPNDAQDETRYSVGLSFYLTPASSVRGAYSVNTEKSGFEKDNDVFILQWNVMF